MTKALGGGIMDSEKGFAPWGKEKGLYLGRGMMRTFTGDHRLFPYPVVPGGGVLPLPFSALREQCRHSRISSLDRRERGVCLERRSAGLDQGAHGDSGRQRIPGSSRKACNLSLRALRVLCG